MDKVKLTTKMRPKEVIEVEGPEYVDLCRQGLIHSFIPNHDVPLPGFNYNPVEQAPAAEPNPPRVETPELEQEAAAHRSRSRSRKSTRHPKTPEPVAPVDLSAPAEQDNNDQEN